MGFELTHPRKGTGSPGPRLSPLGLVPEVEGELVLGDALKYIRRARIRLKELIDVTARLGLMRLHKKYRESWENTEWIEKELKKIIEELEYDYSSP